MAFFISSENAVSLEMALLVKGKCCTLDKIASDPISGAANPPTNGRISFMPQEITDFV